METPKHLSHTPIVSWNDYDEYDAKFKHSDAKALSIGYSTYDNSDISVKVWRKPAERWSRQSEELPIHKFGLNYTSIVSSDKQYAIRNVSRHGRWYRCNSKILFY